jgi:hypothetical protein
MPTTPRKQGAAFLEKLFDILEDPTYEDCISWCDDGKSVLVKKVEEFSQVTQPLLHLLSFLTLFRSYFQNSTNIIISNLLSDN